MDGSYFKFHKMHAVGKVCVILSLLFVGLASGCFTWFTNTTGHCECGATLGKRIICHDDEGRVDVQTGFCMTYDYSTDSALAGYCPYGYSSNMTNRVYSSLPSDPTQLNETTCGPYKREGLLCGQCIKGFGPAVYSYDLQCANCTDISTGYAIILYLLLEFLPITVFFFVIVIFHFNITSGPMLGYVMFCQLLTNCLQANMCLQDSIQILSHLPLFFVGLGRISMVLADIWNLHFLKFVLPSFCLSDKVTDIHVHMLDLFTAVYPVLLIATAYIAIELHAKDNRFIRFLWKPFGICFARFQTKWSASDSITHAFATFIMLSSFTLMYESYTIVKRTPVKNVNGTSSEYVLYYDPSIVWLSPEHSPYLAGAVVLCFFLAVCPALLLCLYPTRIYERLSRCCSPRKRIAVSIFAEALHSCFKDGLNGTRDYRAFAGLCILGPPLCFIVDFAVDSMIEAKTPITTGFLLFFLALSVSYVRPCKSLIMNMSLSFHSMLYGILSVNFELWMEDFSFSTETLAVTFVVVPTISHILILVWTGYKITRCVSSRYGCHLKTALAVLRRAALPLRRRHDYEELCASLETN